MRYFKSQFHSDYSDPTDSLGLHVLDERSEELYTYNSYLDVWLMDRVSAGHYFFPELYVEVGHLIFEEVTAEDVPALLGELESVASEPPAHHQHVQGAEPSEREQTDGLTSAQLGIAQHPKE